MDERTRTALEASIAHWRANAAAKHYSAVSAGCADCALCGLFRKQQCESCPVAARAGTAWCGKTPFAPAIKALHAWYFTLPGEDEAEAGAFRAAATREAEFLESLRDPTAAWVVSQFEETRRK